MSALPRPDLPPGPHRDLVDALHDLHHRAGWPSLRTLARETGVSHTTVSKVFSTPALPSWGTLELLVEAMGGDTDSFRDLWLAATTPPSDSPAPDSPAPGPRIAGRRDELAAVRRHLESGTGLLLVTGEAGIGKTTLVTAAARTTDTFVAAGRCLPLSTQVPLMPVVDVLGAIRGVDGSRWFGEALAQCPPYVAASLGVLLPELGVAATETDDFARQRMLTSIASVVAALAEVRPLAILVEDLHWADASTLDVLEHLLAHVGSARVLATYRSDDPDVPRATLDRIARLRRGPGRRSCDLGPLDRSATRDQLTLALGRPPEPGLVDRIQARTRGHPLFTEQLATTGAETLAVGLTEMFDPRLRRLSPDGWALARALGVADRPLHPHVLGGASGLPPDRVVAVLRTLADQCLLTPPEDTAAVGLRHPLVAEAIRRRLLPGEAAPQHRRIAEALAPGPDAEPGEIARHWQAAGDRQREITWRLAAAERAQARHATRAALDDWSRVLELWPSVDAGTLEISLAQVLCRTIDAANDEGDFDTEQRLVALAETVDATPAERAALLTRAADTHYMTGHEAHGLALLDRALALHADLLPSPELVNCLSTSILFLTLQGRWRESDAAITRALEVLDAIGDDHQRSRILSWASSQAVFAGDHDRATALFREALEVSAASGDPFDQLVAAVTSTDAMLQLGAPVAEIDATAAPALELVARWGITEFTSALLLTILCEAHLRAGDVGGAATVLELDPENAADPTSHPLHTERVLVAALQGHVNEALARIEALDRVRVSRDANWLEGQVALATVELWADLPARAAARLDETLAVILPTDNAALTSMATACAARAHADVVSGSPANRRRAVARRLRDQRTAAHRDPFGPHAVGVAAPVWHAVWQAELAALEDTETVDGWVDAASGWDRLTHPHDAAYCRWRGARVALREGRGTLAHRLLARAAADAREHVPLSRVIAATIGAGRDHPARGTPPVRA
jgi:tetratricopeptide (TPR) repeat protein